LIFGRKKKTMNLKIDLEIEPFKAPGAVFLVNPPGKKEDGFDYKFGTIPTARLDAAVLSELCDKFRAEVFARAGKDDPRLKPLPVPTVGLSTATVKHPEAKAWPENLKPFKSEDF
jgi:hypothetical protein